MDRSVRMAGALIAAAACLFGCGSRNSHAVNKLQTNKAFLERQIQIVENNPNMPADQRAAAIASLKQQEASLNSTR